MKRFLLGCSLAAIVSATPALAADLGGSLKDGSYELANGVSNWNGVYIGGVGGWATGEWNGKLETTAGNPKDNYAGYADPYKTLSADGAVYGFELGAQKQFGRIVLGIEGDYSWTNIEGSASWTTDDYNGDYAKHHSLSIDNLGTARLRAGYAVGRFLPYVTGGLAWAQTHGDLVVSYPNAKPDSANFGKVSTASVDETHIGWTIGGGLETDLGHGWSVKAEYLHVDLGKEGYGFQGTVYNGAAFNTDSFPADMTFDIFRAGLNYRF